MGTRQGSRISTAVKPAATTFDVKLAPRPEATSPGTAPAGPMPADRFVEESLPLLPDLLSKASAEQRERLADVYRGIFHPDGGDFGEEVFAELLKRNRGLNYAYGLRTRADELDLRMEPLHPRRQAALAALRAGGSAEDFEQVSDALRELQLEKTRVIFELKFEPAIAPNYERMRSLRSSFAEHGELLEAKVLGYIAGNNNLDDLKAASAAWVANRDRLAEEVKTRTPRAEVPGQKPAKREKDGYYED